MTQADVLKILEKNPDKWLGSNEISKKLKINRATTAVNLRKLYEAGFILKSIPKMTKGGARYYLYKYK